MNHSSVRSMVPGTVTVPENQKCDICQQMVEVKSLPSAGPNIFVLATHYPLLRGEAAGDMACIGSGKRVVIPLE